MNKVSRLVENFKPKHYNLSLKLNRIDRIFSGTVIISGVSITDSNTIVVHAKDLTIKSVTLDGKRASFSLSNDELHINHPDINKAKHVVVIGFSGIITDPMHGLYPCYYDDKGIKKELLATQFESHHAREVFPCIDEPDAKASFDLTIASEKDIVALSNMPILSQTYENDKLVTKFETTPIMSTYLLAFVLGELHKKTTFTKSGVEVSIWATPAQTAESLDFALEIASKTIDFFDDYFDYPYPLPKSDHVALPDFSSGAMENWGLITYRETTLLADPNTISVASRQYIATVIAHELSHQWFGNLVTMKWWDNLWLNESFATLMEYIAIDNLYPSWNIWLDFASHKSISALRRDSIDGVQAVQTQINHPDEISTLFDGAIVYAKGARLLRMLENYIGKDAFRIGLSAYFKKHAYANTDQDDLWSALSDSSDQDISKLMTTWVSQSGYPVIHVTHNDNRLTIDQEQFFIGPHQLSNKIWPVPISSNIIELPKLLTEKATTIEFKGDKLVKLNNLDAGHFISHYDDGLFEKMIDFIKTNDSSAIDRMQLMNESTLLARAGILPSSKLVKLIKSYKDETSEAVWSIIAMAINELKKFVREDKSAENQLRKFAGLIASKQYIRLGWHKMNDESSDDTKLRAIILGLVLYSEDQDAINTAKSIYNKSDVINIDPEIRALIISSVCRYDDGTEFDKLFEIYQTTSSAEFQQDICVGLTSTRLTEKINLILDSIKNPKIIRPQDAALWFIFMIRSKDSQSTAWLWIRDNWQWVIDNFSSDKSYDDYPRYIATALLTRQQLSEYVEFFEPMLEITVLNRVIKIGILEIKGRIELIERDSNKVIEALNNI